MGAAARQEKVEKAKERSFLANYCCVIPVGRTISFFDIDLLVDIGAYQRCSQLCILEGDLQLHRLAGADFDNPDPIFRVKNVPEVFNMFDEFSFELSQMDLS